MRWIGTFSILLLMANVASSYEIASTVREPIPSQVPYSVQIGSHTWSDPFHWMDTYPGRAIPSALTTYVDEENAYTAQWFEQFIHSKTDISNILLKEFKHKDYTLLSAAIPRELDGYQYQLGPAPGSENAIVRYLPGGVKKEVFFNPAEFSTRLGADLPQGLGAFTITEFRISPDHEKAVIFMQAHLKSRVFIYHSASRRLVEITKEAPTEEFNVEWTPDSKAFLHTINHSQASTSRVLIREALNPNTRVFVVFTQTNERSTVELMKSQDDLYFLIGVSSYAHHEVYALGASGLLANPISPPSLKLLVPEATLRFSFADHDHGRFIIRTNGNEDFYSLYEIQDVDDSQKVLPLLHGQRDSDIDSVNLFENFVLLVRRTLEGNEKIEITDLDFHLLKTLTFNEASYGLSILPHHTSNTSEYLNTRARIIKRSVLVPEVLYSFDRTHGLKKANEVKLPHLNIDAYTAKQYAYPSRDGTQVPLTLVYKKGLDFSKPHPVHYVAYGCYGSDYDLNYGHGFTFNTATSLMDRGMIIAIAHVRGGGDLGLHWYLGGRYQSRLHVLEDFIAGAEYLVRFGVTKKKWIAISSYSAGGFIIGNMISMFPDYWGSAVIHMGFTDYIGSMLNPQIPFTKLEWDLHGNPRDVNDFNWMLPLSPQDNIRALDYPPLYVRAALDDENVMFSEGVKFVAKLRVIRKSSNPLLLTVLGADQGDHDGTYEGANEDAAQYFGFMLTTLGLVK